MSDHEWHDIARYNLVMPQKSMIKLYNIKSISHHITCHVYYLRTPSKKFCWKSLKFKIRHCKNIQCPLSKFSLRYQTVIDQGLTVFHQLFSWTSAGPSKCLIAKMIGSQGHLWVLAYPQVQHYIIQRLFRS